MHGLYPICHLVRTSKKHLHKKGRISKWRKDSRQGSDTIKILGASYRMVETKGQENGQKQQTCLTIMPGNNLGSRDIAKQKIQSSKYFVNTTSNHWLFVWGCFPTRWWFGNWMESTLQSLYRLRYLFYISLMSLGNPHRLFDLHSFPESVKWTQLDSHL